MALEGEEERMQEWGDNAGEPRQQPSRMGSSVVAAVVLGALVTLACSSSSGTDGASAPPDTTGPSGCKSDAECASGGAMMKCNPLTGQCVSSRPPEPEVTVGAACDRDGELACGIDPSTKKKDGSVLYCEGSKYTKVYACPGLQECTPIATSDQVKCGKGDVPSFAKEGAPCATEGNAACSFDREVMHECVNGTWVASRHCPPSECTLQTFDGVLGYSCANGGYSVGDRCRSETGAVVCSTDLTKILSCADGRIVVNQECGSQRCTKVGPNTIGCR